jgi:hypothetical protein
VESAQKQNLLVLRLFHFLPFGWWSVPSSNIIRIIKTGRMRWAEHVARMGREEIIQGFSGETWG